MVWKRRGKPLPRILLALLIAFIGIQVIRPDKTNPPVESDMIYELSPPPIVAAALQRSCYDCHSHETQWPWYSAIAPVSFLLAHDVKEAREHLNFSTWNRYTQPVAIHKLEEATEEVEEGGMPLPIYRVMHRGSRLSEEEKDAFLRWVWALQAEDGTVGVDDENSGDGGQDSP
jgi:hypothetical protein